MDNVELRRCWQLRIDGMRAVNARVSASRLSSSVDELLLRADRMFIRARKTHGKAKATSKTEAAAREVWTRWRARIAAAGAPARDS